MLHSCRQHFSLLRQKFFPSHILCCLLCAKSQVHQFVTNYQTFYYVQISVFFSPILWCCHNGDHPQGDLATFGYRPAMKVEFFY
jgi:hypothetical protein